MCQPFAFRTGEVLSAFSFARPRRAAERASFPQHTILFLHYIRQQPTHAHAEQAILRPGYPRDRPPGDPKPTVRGEPIGEPAEELVKTVLPEDGHELIDLDHELSDARALHCECASPPIAPPKLPSPPAELDADRERIFTALFAGRARAEALKCQGATCCVVFRVAPFCRKLE